MAKDFIELNMNVEEAKNWLNKAKQGMGDLSPVFKSIQPDIKKSVEQEFSDRNPNMWQELSDKYKAWKINHGYPSTIGVMSGNLKWGATDGAIIDIKKKQMTWKLNQAKATYAKWFHGGTKKMPKRNIFRFTVQRIKSIISAITLSKIEKGLKQMK